MQKLIEWLASGPERKFDLSFHGDSFYLVLREGSVSKSRSVSLVTLSLHARDFLDLAVLELVLRFEREKHADKQGS
jgi:hypothetical protein